MKIKSINKGNNKVSQKVNTNIKVSEESNQKKKYITKVKQILCVAIFLFSLVGSIILCKIFFRTGESGYFVTVFFYTMIIFGFVIIPTNRRALKTNIIAVLLILFVTESYLRISKNGFLDYMEMNSKSIFGHYLSKYYEYSGIHDGIYWLHSPNSSFKEVKSEFTQEYNYNEIGLRERPMSEFKNNNFNILILGDSFTEGVGCPQNQNITSTMEFELDKAYNKKNIKVINGGVNGSDLFYSYKLMERLNKDINVKIIVLNLNTSDIDDIACRGGDDRFLKNSVKYVNNSPWWEYFYSFSYIFRTASNKIFNTNPVSYSYLRNQKTDYLKIIYEKVLQYNEYCSKRNINFVLVASPILNELSNNDFLYDNLIEKVQNNTKIKTINLKNIILQNNYINSTNYSEYYYLQDYHFRPKGYQLVGNIISSEISIFCN